jgi:hypothetical protein
VCAFIDQLSLAPRHVGGISDGGIIALTIGMTRPELGSVKSGHQDDSERKPHESEEDAAVSKMLFFFISQSGSVVLGSTRA